MAQLPRLTTPKRIIAWRLSECRPVLLRELIDALYGDDPDGGPERAREAVYAYVTRLRMDFAPFGIVIERGQEDYGWLILPRYREALRTLLAQEIASHGECFTPVGSQGTDWRWPQVASAVTANGFPAAG